MALTRLKNLDSHLVQLQFLQFLIVELLPEAKKLTVLVPVTLLHQSVKLSLFVFVFDKFVLGF